ncbi:50S ribosomal protein L21 [Pararhizobium sp. IMCC21322]|uniref:50S ribosomal protein L21 n=1 Tax=Pararhizobium sp. IMCC21322 TaxID=3067903 RepID=UPI0027423F12|nr:50S ribosomal protein L21 [Pararhizobium sp. IMCC21322]
MFAVIKTGGKQYRVAADDEITIERLAGEAGETIEFKEVLMVGGADAPLIGAPTVDGASVVAEIVRQARGDKIIIFKKRRRQNSRRRNGHRQDLTIVRVTDILTDGKSAPKKAKKAAPKEEEAPKAEEPKAAPKAEKAADAAPAVLFTAPEGEPDDLKKISGVGPVLEKKLHGLGITKYAQVAAFSEDDVTRVDDALSFKGRIGREDWIGQAKVLAEG